MTSAHIPESPRSGQESYEIHWTIENWLRVRRLESLVTSQVAVFETASFQSDFSDWFKTKWQVGLKLVPSSNFGMKARVYWKLLEIKGPGPGPHVTKVKAKSQTQLMHYAEGWPIYTDEKSQEVKLLEIVEETSECLRFKPGLDSDIRDRFYSRNQVKFMLKLTLKTPTLSFVEYERYKMDQFWKTSVNYHLQNQEALLNDPENADLIFLTSDQIEIPAHRIILKAQCPVLSAMLNCDLSENATGVIRMTDITAKTMKLLLHYFYTGSLLPSWRDPDTIVEFTYAAGKYQMAKVLELLDDMLGRDDGGDISHLDVQLISLAAKLKLKNAEERLLGPIVGKIKKIRTSGEFFNLFGYEEEEIQKLANENAGEDNMLRIMNYLSGSNEYQAFLEKGMVVLAKVKMGKLKYLRDNLLKCFGEMVDCVVNADELLEMFGHGKQMEK